MKHSLFRNDPWIGLDKKHIQWKHNAFPSKTGETRVCSFKFSSIILSFIAQFWPLSLINSDWRIASHLESLHEAGFNRS